MAEYTVCLLLPDGERDVRVEGVASAEVEDGDLYLVREGAPVDIFAAGHWVSARATKTPQE